MTSGLLLLFAVFSPRVNVLLLKEAVCSSKQPKYYKGQQTRPSSMFTLPQKHEILL